ncbi:MAG: ribosome assembly protein 4 [Goleter apudmare HA4340-LM2]|jgi:WD40 repeat protein/tetratricopeptide (TPR) repeat protein|nr:ribosome assembly protein 4 [Goleter apudmare HA4340-LM2]
MTASTPQEDHLSNSDVYDGLRLRSLQQLAWAIEASVGQFKLILARCNYVNLRDRLVEQLQEICQVKISILHLKESNRTLYTAIREEFEEELPACLAVLGLESVSNLAQMLTSANQVREEFRKHFTFPLVLWIDDQVYKQLMQVAPDLESWAITRNFAISQPELLDFIIQTANQWFSDHLNLSLQRYIKLETELESAQQDLISNGWDKNLEVKADLESLLGAIKQVNNKKDAALEHYQKSLQLWQQVNNIEWRVKILGEMAYCYYLKAFNNQDQSHADWQSTWHYVEEYIIFLTQVESPDLIAKSIVKLGEILSDLQKWEPLKNFAEKALAVHQANNQPKELARDYGFLAEVALAQENWLEANQFVQQALAISSTTPHLQSLNVSEFLSELPEKLFNSRDLSLYWFILGRSQKHLGQIQEAVQSLEAAKEIGKPQENVTFYLEILDFLQQLYFEQREYLKAYEIKQQRRSIEQRFGLRAFIGAGRLEALVETLHVTSLHVTSAPQENIATEIAASGRQLDVERLIQRIGEPSYKLIVIYGQSGVGKSSLVNAGILPALKQKAIGIQDNLPIVMRVYTNWEEELGRLLGGKHEDGGDAGKSEPQSTSELGSSPSYPHHLTSLLAQLRENEQRNLRTVLIFDQFEEFFFVYTEPAQRKRFFEFLGECLNVLSVKVILSLRVDYLHYLLECNRLPSMKIIGNDILSNNVLYELGNFSPVDAKSIIQRLTEKTSFRLEPALVAQLVEDLAEELGQVRPIELQVVGAQLQTDNITTLAEYQQRGTKEQLVRRYLEAVIQDCGEENQEAAELLLYLLTDEKGTRPLKTRAELERDLKQYLSVREVKSSENPPPPLKKQGHILFTSLLQESPQTGDTNTKGNQAFGISKLDLIVEIFVKSGLVVLLPENPADRYQLVHDYLATFIRQQQEPKLKQVIAELEKERRQRKLSDEKLNHVLKRALFSSVAAGLILAVLAGVSWRWANEAEEQKRKADVNEINALNNSSDAFFLSAQHPDTLLEALKASEKLKSTPWISARSDIQMQTVATLRQAVYLQPNEKLENRIVEVNTFEGHENSVTSIVFSPDGLTLASASSDKTIKIWDVATGQTLKTLKGHNNSVTSVAFSPDGLTLASGSLDKTIKLWDVTTGKTLKTLKRQNNSVTSIAFSPDGQKLAAAGVDTTIQLWDVTTGQTLKTLTGHDKWVSSVAFSPDGQRLASGSWDKTIKLWDVATGKNLKTLPGHDNWVSSVTFSPDGQQLASGSWDKTIKLWDVATGQTLNIFKGHNNSVISLAFSPNGRQLTSGSWDKTIKVWDVATARNLKTLKGHNDSVTSVAFSLNGQQLASGSGDKTIKLWDIATGQILPTFKGHSGLVYDVAYSLDGQQLASGSGDKTIKIWDVATGQILKTLKGHNNWVYSVAFSPDGKQLASASVDKTIKLWDVATGQILKTLKGHDDSVTNVAYSPDGQQLASASDDKTIKIWDVATGQTLKTFTGHDNSVTSVAYSPDGQQLASASGDKTIKIWDIATGQTLKTLKGHDAEVVSVVFSPDGQLLTSGSWDKTIKLWDVPTGKTLKTFKGHDGEVMSVVFSPDGQQLASGSWDKTIKLWNVANGKNLKTLKGHEDFVYSVAFNPNGQQLVSAGFDKTVIMWDLNFNDLLLSGCSLLNNYLVAHPEVLEQLKECQTPSRLLNAATVLVIQGEKLAVNNDTSNAVAKFRKAKQWYADSKSDPLAVTVALVQEVADFTFDPEAKAEVFANRGQAQRSVREGEAFVIKGEIQKSLAAYAEAKKLDPKIEISADSWDILCRQGSLRGFAKEVLFACEKAVSLEPTNGLIRDSRGLARALTGDNKGAIADFTVYIAQTEDQDIKLKRQRWVKDLRAAKNPFTEAELKSLLF